MRAEPSGSAFSWALASLSNVSRPQHEDRALYQPEGVRVGRVGRVGRRRGEAADLPGPLRPEDLVHQGTAVTQLSGELLPASHLDDEVASVLGLQHLQLVL